MASVIAWTDLQARLAAAAITSGGALLPIAWPNKTFDAPKKTNPTDPDQPWLMVQMTGGSGRPMELGGSIWQDDGQSIVHVLVPTNTGVDVANDLIDQVIAMFRGPPTEPVVYTMVTADPGGPGSDDGRYWRTSVSADWYVQTFVARS